MNVRLYLHHIITLYILDPWLNHGQSMVEHRTNIERSKGVH